MSFTRHTSILWDTGRGTAELQLVQHPGVAFGWGYGVGRTFLGLGADFGRFGLRAKVKRSSA